jgi:hypothetical protein
MAKLNAMPNLGDVVVVDVEQIGGEDPHTVRLEFRVTEMDRHRTARLVLRRLDSDQLGEPTTGENTPSSGE